MDKVWALQTIRFYVAENLPEIKDPRRSIDIEERSIKRATALVIAKKIADGDAPVRVFLKDFQARMRESAKEANPHAKPTYKWAYDVTVDIYDILMGMGGLDV